MGNNLKVLIYADIDLNLIDGSSIWVTSLINVFAKSEGIEITLLLKRPIVRPILVDPFRDHKQVVFFDPWQKFISESSYEDWYKRKKLYPEEAIELINRLNRDVKYDIVFIRGLDLLLQVGKNEELSSKTWAYITDIPNKMDSYDDKLRLLKSNFKKFKHIVCQTEEIKNKFSTATDTEKSKFILLPPIIPDYPDNKPDFKCCSKRLVYTGKFDPLWYTREAIDAFVKIHQRYPEAEFHIAGDKFNSAENSAEYKNELTEILENTPGVVWHKGISRQEVEELIFRCDIGISWRHPAVNSSLELSTKLLEYGRLGKPVILNRNPINARTLGHDYPLYANFEEEFIEQIETAFLCPDIYEKAAKKLYEACKVFTYSEAYKGFLNYLWRVKHDGE